MKIRLAILFIGLAVLVNSILPSCEKVLVIKPIENNIQFSPTLSYYKLFKGNMAHLIPGDSVESFELSTSLFTDYAEKQRLVKLPGNTKLISTGDGLPQFPDETILAKTFYYYVDKSDTTKGKKIIETRLMIKHQGKWNVATYEWNATQLEAILLTDGKNKSVSWKQVNGLTKSINYHIPTNTECGGCHRSSDEIIPIGPKLRNMNIDISRNGALINQLQYLSNQNKIDLPAFALSSLPKWDYASFTTEQRARAYLEVNCAHCHNEAGLAASTGLRFGFEIPFTQTKISQRKNEMVRRMEWTSDGKMPKLGTTIVHDEGLELIKRYINTL